MSSHLPYVIPGSVVPGPMYHIPRAGYTSKPISHDPKDAIRPETTAVPDTFRHKAEAGQMRLKDDNLVKVIQQALQKEGASKQQTQTTDKQALPSDLAWRG